MQPLFSNLLKKLLHSDTLYIRGDYMTISKDNDRVNVVISKKEKRELKELADKENRSLSNMVAKIIQEYLLKKELS